MEIDQDIVISNHMVVSNSLVHQDTQKSGATTSAVETKKKVVKEEVDAIAEDIDGENMDGDLET